MSNESAAVYLPPSDLNPWEGNPRVNDHVVDKVALSIERFNFGAPILARKDDMMVIAGHTRLKAALKLGLERVPVRLLDLTIPEAKALALADNKLSELASWSDSVDEVLRSIEDEVDISALGWSQKELDEIIASNEPLIEDDSEIELPEDAVSVPGQVYQLGRHTLYCGDSTDEKIWEAMGRVDAVITDPPYGLGNTTSSKNNYSTYEDSADNLEETISGFLPLSLDYSSRVIITPGVGNIHKYPEPKWTLAWFTPAGAGSGPWGFCCWQPVLCYGKDPKLTNGLGRNPDAIVHTESSEKLGHPCSKPINFWSWLIERTTLEDESIADPFGGSGTSIIASEMTGRTCSMIELDPRYCDLIRRRWTRFAIKNNLGAGKGALND